MRTLSVLGALGQRRLGEMASAASLISLDGCEHTVFGIDWGGESGDRAYVYSVDPDPRTLREAVEIYVARQFLESRGSRTPGKTKMLASSYTGMHNEGAFWVDASGSYPFYGPWLPHPEPEVVHV